MSDIDEAFVRLTRLTLSGRQEEAAALARRTINEILKRRPELAREAREALAGSEAAPTRLTPPKPVPVDADSRLELLRVEEVPELTPAPVWSPAISYALNAVVAERERLSGLAALGLLPTRSLLFVGPPGVGKTLAARWLARRLHRTLLTLDLSAVMSSFLGRTGNNIRVVLDYARQSPSVLLLDEFDAIAKRRDDATEVGELKRLVTVLLQEVEEWPSKGLLIAATNHPELLDPAVWRRFDSVLDFPLPDSDAIGKVVRTLANSEVSEGSVEALAKVLTGLSFSDIARAVTRARRRAFLAHGPLEAALKDEIATLCKRASRKDKMAFARYLATEGRSQHEISEWTGVSRDTLRRHGISPPAPEKGDNNAPQE